jgi:hypothetical protein
LAIFSASRLKYKVSLFLYSCIASAQICHVLRQIINNVCYSFGTASTGLNRLSSCR